MGKYVLDVSYSLLQGFVRLSLNFKRQLFALHKGTALDVNQLFFNTLVKNKEELIIRMKTDSGLGTLNITWIMLNKAKRSTVST